MTVGAATVEPPTTHGPLPKPVAYVPPSFSGCISHLRESAPKSIPVAPLLAECKATYQSIQTRILNFLITGYWLRNQAARDRLSISSSEVHNKFEKEKRAHYPTAASFRRLTVASDQTVPDLEFAVETQMLSAKLVEVFNKAHPDEASEAAAAAAFNSTMRREWTPLTDCAPGYVVPDCRQYRLPAKVTK